MKDHAYYMCQAIKLAKKAYKKNEVPIGAVVVDKNGDIIGRGYNKMEATKCQTGHAEVIAIQKACKKKNDWRLDNCTIYVTLEPCMMCFGLIQLSRIKTLVFGGKSPLFGFSCGMFQPEADSEKSPAIIKEIKKEECIALLQQFFKNIRST
jgi:tRNA(adenine34) deaminase